MKKISDLDFEKKKYIIFDMDGTLIDSVGVWNQVDQILIMKYGGILASLEDIQRDRDDFFNSNTDGDIYVKYCGFLYEKYKISSIDNETFTKMRKEIGREISTIHMDYKDSVVELLKLIKDLGFTLILATVTNRGMLDIYSSKNERMSRKLDLYGIFDYIISKEDVINKKPDPEIYNKIVEHFNASREECLIFEDSYTGVMAAKRAAIECVNVYDKYSDKDRDKINELCDYRIDSYDEVIELLKSISFQNKKI